MDQVVLNNVTKNFTTKTLGTVTAVDNFSLSIKEGEVFSFLGPSGCGKTTTLRMIAGFEDLSEGEIYLEGKAVSVRNKNLYVPPEKRGLGMVFQSFAVWPHMNIYDNVAFPLKVRKLGKAETEKQVKRALAHTSLSGMENAYPSDLSGGQQQRIALARAIVTNPKVMLLDEPLSNLDPQLRESMRFEIKELSQNLGLTVVFVTHDQAEAMAISDRILVMDMGKIMQVGTPTELYNRPNSRFVHDFLGESTFTRVKISNGKAYALGDNTQAIPAELPEKYDENMLMATRPNFLTLNKTGNGFKTKVEKRIFLTSYIEYLVRVGEDLVKVQTPHRVEFSEGEECYLELSHVMWYPLESRESIEERERRQVV